MNIWGYTRSAALVAALSLLAACGESEDRDDTDDCGDNEIVVDHACCLDINANGVCDKDETASDCTDDEAFINDLCCVDADANGICDSEETGDGCAENESLVDGECCVDVNHNNICDADETEDDCEQNEEFIGGVCCVDADANGICDADECAANESYVDGACCVDENANGICDADECAANESYVDGACCVDADANGICDADECAANESYVDGACCVDENANGVCDADETSDDCDPLTEIYVDGLCCEDLDGDSLCDDDPADSCFGLDNGNDADADGFCADTDCDDNNALVYSGAPELCGFGVVNDCDNPCYAAADGSPESCGNQQTFRAVKEGLVGEHDNEDHVWRDATNDVAGAGVVYHAEGHKTLYFCGFTEDSATEVDIRAAGVSTTLELSAGIHPNQAMIFSSQDQPVLQASGNARIALRDMVVSHHGVSEGQNAHGLRCEGATVHLQSTVVFAENSAEEGGAIYAEKCELFSSQSVVFTNNHAKIGGGMYLNHSIFDHGRSRVELSGNSAARGAAMFLTNKSQSKSTQGQMNVFANSTLLADSAAVHLVGESSAPWISTLSLTNPGHAFQRNVGPNNVYLDLVISDGSRIEMSPVNFTPSSLGHVSNDLMDYAVTTPNAELECDDSTCTY